MAGAAPDPAARCRPREGPPVPRRLAARVLAVALLLALTGAGVVWLTGGASGSLWEAGVDAEARVARLRDALEAFGALAPAAYVALVTIEVVVAPLPGTLLYAPGGVLFGGLWGGLLSLVGNIVGAAVAFELMRRLGRGRSEAWFGRGRLRRHETLLRRRGGWVVFALRVNPLTSSDLVSYAAGLTPMPRSHFLLGTTLGMAPLCWAQAYAAESLIVVAPWLLYPVLVAGLLYVLAALWLLWRAG